MPVQPRKLQCLVTCTCVLNWVGLTGILGPCLGLWMDFGPEGKTEGFRHVLPARASVVHKRVFGAKSTCFGHTPFRVSGLQKAGPKLKS